MENTKEVQYRGKMFGREEMDALKRIGKTIEPDGFEYAGSVAIHFYEQTNAVDSRSGATINQVHLDELGERFVQEGLRSLRDHIMVNFGRKKKSEFIK